MLVFSLADTSRYLTLWCLALSSAVLVGTYLNTDIPAESFLNQPCCRPECREPTSTKAYVGAALVDFGVLQAFECVLKRFHAIDCEHKDESVTFVLPEAV